MSRSEKIARLKAGKRLKMYNVGKWILAVSEVSSYEASACRGILTLGADITIVEAITKDGLRVSLRSTQKFYEETNISLGNICMEISKKSMEATGGGHPTAAGFNGSRKDKNIIVKIVELIKEKLNLKEKLLIK